MKNLLKKIKESEGYSKTVYQCTEGYDTIGYGFAVKDLELSKEVSETILREKITKLKKDIENRFEWVVNAPPKIQDVVIEMCYQIGINGFSKFKKTIYFLETEQYWEASVEMLDSLWARQTPNRAKKLSDEVRGNLNVR